MKGYSFVSLSCDEAKEILHQFIMTEKEVINKFVDAINRDGVCADFSIYSNIPVLQWVIKKVNVVAEEPDFALPNWIVESPTYLKSLFDIDDSKKPLILHSGFYLGESFIRYSDELFWDVGEADTAMENMPVVSGFKHGMQMPPIMVVKNLVGRILHFDGDVLNIEMVVNSWISSLPK